MTSTRELYETINFIMNECKNIPEFTYKKRLKASESFKREVRRRIKKQSEENSIIYFGWDSSGYGGYTKEYFDYHFTEEEKKKYREANWISINSPYDCTGKLFTHNIYIFNFRKPNSLGARSVVYHWMGRDV